MEHIGYILSFTGLKTYYCDSGETTDPFECKFYIHQEEAATKRSELEKFYKKEVNLIKVKRTIKIVS